MTNRTFMTVEEVAAELGVSKSYAYKIVKQLNEELQKLGYLTVAGRWRNSSENRNWKAGAGLW